MMRKSRVFVKRLAVFFVFLTFCTSSFAGTVPPVPHDHALLAHESEYLKNVDLRLKQKNENSWFWGLGGGLSWVNLSNGYTTVLNGAAVPPPYNVDYYSIKTPAYQHHLQSAIGYRWQQTKRYFPYLSLYAQYRHYFPTYIEGTINQYSLAGFENYDYRMTYTADLLTVNAKVNLVEAKNILPYLALGVGGIFNHLHLYQEYPLANVTARVNPGFGDHTNANPVITLGLGLDYKATRNWWITLGYELLFQGSITTQNGTDAWSSSHLVFSNNTKMNIAFLQITANIPEGFQELK